MKTPISTSTCRLCRYYQPVGRRGGTCQLLSVPVRGSWKACSLAIQPFTTSWALEELLQDEKLIFEKTFSVDCSRSDSQPNRVQEHPLTAQMVSA